MNALEGKVAIVTGASSGIGRATALLFARNGARVVLGARRGAELERLADEIDSWDGASCCVKGDVRDEGFAKSLVDTAVERFGGLDIAFNNAGTLGELGPTPNVPLAAWREAIDTNLTSAFLGARYQLPAMLRRGGGSLIFTSTFVGYTVGFPGAASYAASKAGLIGLTQALAAEFGPKAIRVNAILPGGTDTPMGRQMNGSPEALANVANMHALKRIAHPEEIAQSVLYLASDASSFTTGSALVVDGGISINRT
jgi:NAD(P)-dependent dehydrogenase (short-subunit alcohol dehydrogenase family)